MASTIHGTSRYMGVAQDNPDAKANFYDFAPASCVCCACCAPDAARERTFMHVYPTKMVNSSPIAPCGPCTLWETCIVDMVSTTYFDKPPHRAGMCCFCIPATCCGPPVIFATKPVLCCCIPISDYCGESVNAAPCNCCGIKLCLCCGPPCYLKFAYPLKMGIKDASGFLGQYKKSVELYKAGAGADIPAGEYAVFDNITDDVLTNIGDRSTGAAVGAAPAAESMEH